MGGFSTGKSAAKRQARSAEENLQRQRQREQAALAEEDDAIARTLALAEGRKGGRRSLIRTSERGLEPRKTLG